MAAAHVRIGEIRPHLAVPIHLLCQEARGGAFRFIFGVPRPIADHEQVSWAGAANCLEDARRE